MTTWSPWWLATAVAAVLALWIFVLNELLWSMQLAEACALG